MRQWLGRRFHVQALNTSARDAWRRLPPRLGRVPRGYPATWLVAVAAVAGMVAAADVGGFANLPAVGDGLAK